MAATFTSLCNLLISECCSIECLMDMMRCLVEQPSKPPLVFVLVYCKKLVFGEFS